MGANYDYPMMGTVRGPPTIGTLRGPPMMGTVRGPPRVPYYGKLSVKSFLSAFGHDQKHFGVKLGITGSFIKKYQFHLDLPRKFAFVKPGMNCESRNFSRRLNSKFVAPNMNKQLDKIR